MKSFCEPPNRGKTIMSLDPQKTSPFMTIENGTKVLQKQVQVQHRRDLGGSFHPVAIKLYNCSLEKHCLPHIFTLFHSISYSRLTGFFIPIFNGIIFSMLTAFHILSISTSFHFIFISVDPYFYYLHRAQKFDLIGSSIVITRNYVFLILILI